MIDLFVELRFPAGTVSESVDVHVQVEPATTVATLTGALASHVGRHRAVGRLDLAIERQGRASVLNPAVRVLDAGLMSGDVVVLLVDGAGVDARTTPLVGGLELDVVGGLDAGRIFPLRGQVVVGRAATCTAVVVDRKLAAQHFTVEPSVEGRAIVTPCPGATVVVGGEVVAASRRVEPGEIIHAGASVFSLRRVASDEVAPAPGRSGTHLATPGRRAGQLLE
jgi:hypothetical protein